jgi:hypothetical protein
MAGAEGLITVGDQEVAKQFSTLEGKTPTNVLGSSKVSVMTPDAAEIIALQALGFIAADEQTLRGLQATTGLDAEILRSQATEVDVLAGVLEFLLADENRLLAFCETAKLDPRLPGRARSVLTGEPLFE